MTRVCEQIISEVICRKTFIKVIFVGPDYITRDLENLWSSTLTIPLATTAYGSPYPAPFRGPGQKMQW